MHQLATYLQDSYSQHRQLDIEVVCIGHIFLVWDRHSCPARLFILEKIVWQDRISQENMSLGYFFLRANCPTTTALCNRVLCTLPIFSTMYSSWAAGCLAFFILSMSLHRLDSHSSILFRETWIAAREVNSYHQTSQCDKNELNNDMNNLLTTKLASQKKGHRGKSVMAYMVFLVHVISCTCLYLYCLTTNYL